jgi:hypothetical protein
MDRPCYYDVREQCISILEMHASIRLMAVTSDGNGINVEKTPIYK